MDPLPPQRPTDGEGVPRVQGPAILTVDRTAERTRRWTNSAADARGYIIRKSRRQHLSFTADELSEIDRHGTDADINIWKHSSDQ